ncbi:unnamed protein product, partial [Lampetra fluviatilis]
APLHRLHWRREASGELARAQAQVQDLQRVARKQGLAQGDLDALHGQIDEVGEEVSRLLEGRMRRGDPGDDKLVLFRQQAAIISRKRAARAEELQAARERLQEMEHSREERGGGGPGGGGRGAGGEEVIGGDEFKRYVARLRSKNTLYKRQKQQLWDSRAELGVLTRTRDLLAQRLGTATQRLLALEERRGVAGFSEAQDDLEKVSRTKQHHDEAKAQTLGDMSHMVRELNALITDKKAALSPVIKELRPLRQHCQELGEEFERRKSQYESCAAGLESNRSQLEQEVRALREEVRLAECHYHLTKQQSQMVQVLLDRAGVEMRAYVSPDPHERKRALREQYNKLILEQDNVGKKLRELQRSVRESHAPSQQQVRAWRDTERLLLHKLQQAAQVQQAAQLQQAAASSPQQQQQQQRRWRSPPGPRQGGRRVAAALAGEVQEERLCVGDSGEQRPPRDGAAGALQYRCKMLLYSSCMVLVAFYMLPACFYRGKNVINLRIASRLGRHTKWLIGVTYRALGGERMGGSGACVIVSNHQSSLDFLGMMEFLPERGVLVAKREIMLYTGPFGLASYLCGTLFIDRRDPDRAKEAVAKFARSLLPQDVR